MVENESENTQHRQTVKYDHHLKMLRVGEINMVVNRVVFVSDGVLITTDMGVFLLIANEKTYRLLMEEVTIAVDKT